MKPVNIGSKIAAIGLIILLSACASGYKAYQKGNYYKASIEAVERLRGNATHKKAQEALAKSYPLAQQSAMREILNAMSSKNLQSYDRAIQIYEDLNHLAEEINHCPGALAIIPNPVSYYRELNETKEKVAEISYQEGLKALRYGTMEQARIAFENFNRTHHYVPGYKDVVRLIEESRYKATLRVIVMKPITNSRYQLDADFFYDRLMSEITRNTYRRLVRFYTPEEAKASRMNDPHELLYLDFADFTVGNSRQTSNTIEVKRDSVLVGTANGQNVYGTVKAKFTTHRIELGSSGVMTLRITDPKTSRVLQHRNFSGSSIWRTEWATFNGDERALSSQQKAMVGRRPQPLPPPQVLFASFAEPLYAEATRYISSIY